MHAAGAGDPEEWLFAFDELVLDTRAFELTHRGEVVALQKKPLDVLIYLVVHRDRVVTKAEILSQVWAGVRVTENALVQAIASVRAALGACGVRAIRSIRGRGYRFALPVRALAADSQRVLARGPDMVVVLAVYRDDDAAPSLHVLDDLPRADLEDLLSRARLRDEDDRSMSRRIAEHVRPSFGRSSSRPKSERKDA